MNFTPLLDFFFPRFCTECGRHGTYACASCLEKVQRFPSPLCPVCFSPLTHIGRHAHCAQKGSLDGLIVFGHFEGVLKNLIVDIKYHGYWDQIRALAPLIPHIPGIDTLDADTIVPIPLHPKKLRGRGYNQSMLLAQQVTKHLKKPLEKNGLQKSKNTPSQAGLDKKERKKNLEDAFRVRMDCMGKTILLVDDVVTTGSTLQECARVLKIAGAKKVYALAIAHGK